MDRAGLRRGALVFALAAALAIAYTWPVAADMNGSFYGFPWDSLGSIASFWWFKYAFLEGIPFREHTFISFPAGVALTNSPLFYINYLTGLGLSLAGGELFAYNAMKILSFPLLASSAYVLINYLVKSPVVSAWAALAFAFSPFHTVHLMSHQPNLYWLPLLIYALLKALREGGTGRSASLGAILGLTLVDSTYYMFFVAVLSPVFIALALWERAERPGGVRGATRCAAVAAAAFIAVVVPMAAPMLGDMARSRAEMHALNVVRPLSDLFVFSAKPLDYLMPSRYNPFIGWLVPDLGVGVLKGHRYIEHTLYLGWVLLCLAACAVFSAAKGKGPERKRVAAFLVLAVAAAILSGPPFIPLGEFSIDPATREVTASRRLLLPQYFLFKAFPVFRSYARAGAVVGLAVTVLAAFGLKSLLARGATAGARAALLAAVTALLAAEFAEYPPFRVTGLKVPEHYVYLARLDDSPVIEYPFGPPDDPYTTYEYQFYQRVHRKRLVNGSIVTDASWREEVKDLSNPGAVEALSAAGVRYVLLHRDKYENGNEYVPLDWITRPPRDKLFPDGYSEGRPPDLSRVRGRLRVLKDFGPAAIYEILPEGLVEISNGARCGTPAIGRPRAAIMEISGGRYGRQPTNRRFQ